MAYFFAKDTKKKLNVDGKTPRLLSCIVVGEWQTLS